MNSENRNILSNHQTSLDVELNYISINIYISVLYNFYNYILKVMKEIDSEIPNFRAVVRFFLCSLRCCYKESSIELTGLKMVSASNFNSKRIKLGNSNTFS